jgi:predicted metalloprotease with PDZ domain
MTLSPRPSLWPFGFLAFVTASVAAWAGADATAPKPAAITLDVDATEAPRRLFHARLVIPAAPGPLTLSYPKWIPGEHGPNGPIADLSGLTITAAGKAVPWRRDEVDLYAFHCDVPAGAKAVEVALDYLMPSAAQGYSAGASATPQLAILNWHLALLYPKGRSMRDLEYAASITVPTGWKVSTALPVAARDGQRTAFAPVTLERLADSLVLCGEHLRETPIGPAGDPPHFLVVACDSAAGAKVGPAMKAKYDRLVAEAGALFGARHYGSYRFLLSLSDQIRPTGIEHHESSDDRAPERMFLDEDLRTNTWLAYLLPHEYVHSWNGKYRRPADMVTRDFQQPQRTRLLWVYEGLTEYLGVVLTARSGLWTPEQTRDHLAVIADQQQNQRGRSWRPLEDTAVAAPFLYGARTDWSSRRRGVDFYDEGTLLWLDVDTLIRHLTHSRKSLDDFCKRFHGGESGPPEVKPYTFDDIVADLNAVAPYDWKALLLRRVAKTADGAPLDGLQRGGWRLAYADTASPYHKGLEGIDKVVSLPASIGLTVTTEGAVVDVIPGKAADRAGVGPGMKLIAVNTRGFTPDLLRESVAATKTPGHRLELLMKNGEFFKTHLLDYQGGAKYARLERDPGQEDILAQILKPLTPANGRAEEAGTTK